MGLRLIDADALKVKIIEDAPGFLDSGSSITKAFILAMLETRNATPTIDAVQVVRCKYCKHQHDPSNCFAFGTDRYDEWFCADGSRKDGEANG